jgi:CubicO group peptidase (beta-lactamase class C family)
MFKRGLTAVLICVFVSYFVFAQQPGEEKEFLQEIKKLVNRLSESEVFSGTLLVAKDSNVIFSYADGEASKRYHVPINIDTKFNLGSMNKMFTSLTIMILVENGKLALEDTIDKFVDETWLPKDITAKITIHNLLTHSSGLGSYFNALYMRSSRQLFRKLDDYKPLIKSEKLAFEPGNRFQYSNTGMFLLGVVIENVTGEDYFDTIRKMIYEPAGMKDTDCYEMDYPVENLAVGYSPDKGYIIAVMSNLDNGASPLARQINTLLTRVKEDK